MHALTGYCDRWSVKPGDTIRFMVGSAGGRDFALRFVRHICADPNPDGPGYPEIAMPSALDGTHRGPGPAGHLGSFGHVASLPVDLRGGVLLSATIWPTTPGKGPTGAHRAARRWLDADARHRPGRRRDGGGRRPDGASARAEVACRLLRAALVRRGGDVGTRRRDRA